MPIHYAAILSKNKEVVLQGMYENSQTSFKTQVVQNSAAIKLYGYSEAGLENKLKILYHNWDTVTAAIVISHEIDRQECQEFLEHFKQMVESKILGKKANYQTP